MTTVQRLRSGSSQKISTIVTTLVIGVIVGFLVAWNVVLFAQQQRYHYDPPSLQGGLQQQQVIRQKQGWNEIHVFYAQESAYLGDDKKEKWVAQVHQDQVVADLLGNTGYFIDLAANDAKELSNTLALERLGWNGLCLEPNSEYWYGLSHRKCTVVGAFLGGTNVQAVDVKFRGVYGGIKGRMNEKLANRKNEPDAKTERRYTVPLTDVFDKFHVPKTIDYLSLDVEGSEFVIMQNFPFDQYKIRVLTIERPKKKLKELLTKHGYIHLKDLAWWGETLWAHKSTGLTPTHPKIAKIQTEERN